MFPKTERVINSKYDLVLWSRGYTFEWKPKEGFKYCKAENRGILNEDLKHIIHRKVTKFKGTSLDMSLKSNANLTFYIYYAFLQISER